MFERFRNFSIKKKLVLGFVTCNVLFGVLALVATMLINVCAKSYETSYYGYGEKAGDAAYAYALLNETVNEAEKTLILSGTEKSEAAAKAAEAFTKMKGIYATLGENLLKPQLETDFKALAAEVTALAPDLEKLLTSAAAGDDGGVRSVLNNEAFEAQEAKVVAAFDTFYNSLTTLGQKKMANGRSQSSVMVIALIVVLAVVVVFSVLLVRTVSTALRIPVNHMAEVAQTMAGGDVDVEIKHYYNDELGELADSLKAMVANIREQAGFAQKFADGDYDVEITPKSDRDLLGNSFATIVSEENRTMSGIREAVLEIKTGSEQVAAASQSLAQGSTEQASAIQQITASINDITERTKVNAADATNANHLVVEARTDATEGNEKMKEMIEAMADINTSSENISKIIKVIDDIAFQTNILALNAAVEAARAGQHGRGFAVVADEVRNLAGKSAQAASETAELIEDSIEKVNKGSRLAEETAKALESIVEVIEKIVGITDSIATASNEQASVISQIDAAIGQVSQVVQTNSATSEECAAASEELSAQAGKLREMIVHYKLKKTSSSAAPTGPVSGFASASDEQPRQILPPDEDEIDSSSIEGIEDDIPNDVPDVISLDDGFGKY